jgi:hypothetical protein
VNTSTQIAPIRLTAIMILLGFVMTLGMISINILDIKAVQYHDPKDSVEITNDIKDNPDRVNLILLGILFDNFFILGYTGIFYALYLYTKHTNFWAKIGIIAGFSTAIFDIIENAIQVALLQGISEGWDPNNLIWVFLWGFTFIKDISSYLAGFVFIVLLIVTINDSPELKTTKLIVAVLLGIYVLVGSLGLVNPAFLLIRNLSFVIDLLIAGILFYKTPIGALPE